MLEKNQILHMSFLCTDVYGCPKLLDMIASKDLSEFELYFSVRYN